MKKKTLRVIALLVVIMIVIGGTIAYKLYNKPHRSAATENAVAIAAADLVKEYEKSEANANKKYLDKAIQVTGRVADTASNQQNKRVITLQGSDMSGVQCTLLENNNTIKAGDTITVTGFCTGYLTDVIIDRGVFIPRDK